MGRPNRYLGLFYSSLVLLVEGQTGAGGVKKWADMGTAFVYLPAPVFFRIILSELEGFRIPSSAIYKAKAFL